MGGVFGGERRRSEIPEMRISGTLDELLIKLQNIKVVTEARKAIGWRYFQDDEDWSYEVRGDERVCSYCLSYAGRWVGSMIPTEFSDYRVWDKAHVKPGTHIYYPFLVWSDDPDSYGGCRCNLRWYDYLFVLANRLLEEMESVV